MSNYLFLKQITICPTCRRPHKIPKLYGQCRNCGEYLFESHHNFQKFESDLGWREYYVWDSFYGWRHRTHILDEHGKQKSSTKPLTREVVAEKLPDNYGTSEFIQEKLDNSRIELKEALKHKKKIGVMHK